MTNWYSTRQLYCRWCNKPYESKKAPPLAGFCCQAHKQAHHRAYKKWVTHKRIPISTAGSKRVTHKKAK